MLNKTFHLLLLLLIPILGFSQANSQYPDSGNKIRLGFQTTADGLIWRDTQPNVGVYQPINNKAAWVVLDTVNNKLYHYKNSAWTLVGGDTTSLSNRIDLRLKISDTTNMLSPYWRADRFSGVLPVANGGTNASTFTAGSVVFAGASGTYTQDNSNLFWDNTNKRLGIGTNTGTNTLTVKQASASMRIESTTGTNFTDFRMANTGGTLFNGISRSTGGILGVEGAYEAFVFYSGAHQNNLMIGTGGHLRFLTSNDNGSSYPERMRITSTGNVGIGQTTPTSRLHVKGVTNTSGESALNVTNSSDASLLFVRNDGNVGIGTTSPTVKLDVTGSVFVKDASSSGAPLEFPTIKISNTKVSTSINDYSFSSFAFFGSNELVKGEFFADGSGYFNTGTPNVYFRVGSNHPMLFGTNSLERMRITSTGNVGIGTVTPLAKLHTEVAIENPATGAVALIAKTYNGANDIFRWFDGATQLGVFKNNGNVGIGTTSPNVKLHIQNGTSANTLMQIMSFGTEAVGEYAGLQFKSAATSVNEYAKALIAFRNKGIGYGRGDIYFCVDNGADGFNADLNDVKMVIDNIGNVGIGVSSPSYKLDVNGKGSFKNTGGSPALDIRASDVNFALMSILGNQGSDVNWLLMSGYPNPGDFTIRQSDVVNALTVTKTTGAATFSSSVKSTQFQLTNSSGQYYYFDNATGNNFIGLTSTNTLGLYVGGNLSLSIASTGAATFSNQLNANNVIRNIGAASNTIGSGVYYYWQNTTTSSADIALQLNASNGLDFWYFRSGNWQKDITFNPTGAASFSSSVTIGNSMSTGILTSGSTTIGNINAKSFLLGTNGTETNYRWQNYIDASSNYKLYSRTYGDALSISYTTGAVTIATLGSGTVYSNSGVLSNTSGSDERLKNNINDISWGLSDILKLRPVSFNWKDDKISQGKQFGFIAQEVREVMPEAIKIFGEDVKYLGLEKDAIYATLVKAVQELSAQVDILKQEIINLKNK